MQRPFDVTEIMEGIDASILEESYDTPRAGPSPYSPPRGPNRRSDSERLASRPKDFTEAIPEAQDTSANDPVNHPIHYVSHPSGIECIIITEWMNFNLGNCVKYVWRANDKGATIQDLEKAKWYLEREINRLKRIAAQS